MTEALPHWPRLMGLDVAAAYCGISASTFELRVGVEPVRLGSRKLWDKKRLDAWIDGLSDAGPQDWLGVLDAREAQERSPRRRRG